MGIVEWDESFAIGVEIVDTQHRELFRVINSFHDRIGAEDDAFALGVVLDSLKNYVTYHFATEEKLLARCGCPELAMHQGAHAAFAALVASYETNRDAADSGELLKLQNFLVGWLVNHIKHEDLRLKDYFLAAGNG
ncbi:bacteriohemerythrin [Fundidesulfovibrio putealis]|uniref:bacteriohemerythrin n=1 Tax=Fundidesulfovibrio putealis TaxID=270496 RepID=UPI000415FF7A|nr:hemerythrin family protein [Fundidesulfovibrio putealis]